MQRLGQGVRASRVIQIFNFFSMQTMIIYLKKDFPCGRGKISAGTACMWHGARDKDGKRIVGPKGKNGKFYLTRHIPDSYFE